MNKDPGQLFSSRYTYDSDYAINLPTSYIKSPESCSSRNSTCWEASDLCYWRAAWGVVCMAVNWISVSWCWQGASLSPSCINTAQLVRYQTHLQIFKREITYVQPHSTCKGTKSPELYQGNYIIFFRFSERFWWSVRFGNYYIHSFDHYNPVI